MGPALRGISVLPARVRLEESELDHALRRAIELTGLCSGAAYGISPRGVPVLHAHVGFAQPIGLADFFGYPRLLADTLAAAKGRIVRLRGASPDDLVARSVLARAGVSLMVLVPIRLPTHPLAALVLGAPRVSARWQLAGPTHTQRVSRYCRLLARLGGLPERYAELTGQAGALHDVGKLAVPEAVLMKPGKLTPPERRLIERHADDGRVILSGPHHPLGDMAAEVAWTHHERWDGTGYPRGLRGTQIPLEGRIAAIADVFDALTSDRPYRPGLPLDDALARLRAGAGTHFDPRLVELFTAALPRLYRLQERVLQRQTAVARRVPVLAVAPA
jgi:hypothetical protein